MSISCINAYQIFVALISVCMKGSIGLTRPCLACVTSCILLIREETHKVDVIKFSQNKALECSRNNNLLDRDSARLLWDFIMLLCRQNGVRLSHRIESMLCIYAWNYFLTITLSFLRLWSAQTSLTSCWRSIALSGYQARVLMKPTWLILTMNLWHELRRSRELDRCPSYLTPSWQYQRTLARRLNASGSCCYLAARKWEMPSLTVLCSVHFTSILWNLKCVTFCLWNRMH